MSAIGTAVDKLHPHILRCVIDRGEVERAIINIVGRMPRALQGIVAYLWPGLFLPLRVVLKAVKPDQEGRFNNEKKCYETLKPVQGHLVPILYGEGRWDGNRALVLSDVDGIMPFDQQKPFITTEEFVRRLRIAFEELAVFNLYTDDNSLRNVMMTGERITIIDLEEMIEDTEDGETILRGNIDTYSEHYRDLLRGHTHYRW